jgi:hypothetical protein
MSGFNKGTLLVKETSGNEKLLVKMIGGPALAQTALGNPLSGGGTAYDVCIYDDGGTLVGQLNVDRAGDTCGGAPCWKAIGGDPPAGKGYKYKDAALSAAGVSKIIYKGGDAGKSKALVKGSDAPQCLSLTVTDIKKHDADFFKAKK